MNTERENQMCQTSVSVTASIMAEFRQRASKALQTEPDVSETITGLLGWLEANQWASNVFDCIEFDFSTDGRTYWTIDDDKAGETFDLLVATCQKFGFDGQFEVDKILAELACSVASEARIYYPAEETL